MKNTNSEPIIVGTVINRDNVKFVGFCKVLYDKSIQNVDVFVGDNKIDTVVADGPYENLCGYSFWDLCDIKDNHCFTYILPEEYHLQIANLKFKDPQGKEIKIVKTKVAIEKEALEKFKK